MITKCTHNNVCYKGYGLLSYFDGAYFHYSLNISKPKDSLSNYNKSFNIYA